MECNTFVPERDYSILEQWHTLRGLGCPPKAALPKYGLIVPDTAAGFLYQTDSCIAIVDGYISNPYASRGERDAALDLITQVLLIHAKALGFSHVKCETKFTSIEIRAKRHGFVSMGSFAFYVKEL